MRHGRASRADSGRSARAPAHTTRQFRAFSDPRCHVLSPEPWWRSPGCTSLLHATGDYVLATDAHMSVGAGVTAVRRNLEYVPE